VDTSATSNVLDDPLFRDLVSTGNDTDLNIQTIEAGDLVDSPCKDAASSSDIGAFQFSVRGIDDESWTKYQLEYNPATLNPDNIITGFSSLEDGQGSLLNFGKSDKRVFPLAWFDDSYSTKTQRETLRYISTLIRTRENGLSLNETLIRLHFKPTNKIYTGTSATVSATNKTLADGSQSWITNELKGFFVSIEFTSGSSTGTIAASGKTLTVSPSPSWTTNEWTGYYFPYGLQWYYIQSPNSELVNASSIDWTIEKYFKILSNTSDTLTLKDDDSELVAGSYDFNIDFIETRVQNSNFSYMQFGYDFDNEISKTGYEITFQEA
jgi:hypothetical protein